MTSNHIQIPKLEQMEVLSLIFSPKKEGYRGIKLRINQGLMEQY
jgi:hypothetical protein